jgi:hypothetical protein
VTETRDPSPPETRADSSDIALHNDSESDRLLQDASMKPPWRSALRASGSPVAYGRTPWSASPRSQSWRRAALRVVALVSARNPSHAAECLEMAPVSLTRWSYRRPWLMAIVRELKARRDHDDD